MHKWIVAKRNESIVIYTKVIKTVRQRLSAIVAKLKELIESRQMNIAGDMMSIAHFPIPQ